MIKVTGDTHGNQREWMRRVEPELAPGDTLIVCGDFGVGFWDPRWCGTDDEFYDYISEQNYTVLFCDGNHEDFQQLYRYPVEEWNGGRVHRIRHNLIHLMRGEVYELEGKKIFAFGGGYSVDRYRRTENFDWWPQEMPSPEEYRNAEQNLRKVNYEVDYVITHTAPSDSVYYLSTLRGLGIRNDVTDELPLTSFLNNMQEQMQYRYWYFGHFHVDVEIWRYQTAVYHAVRELETGKIVNRE